MHCLTRDLVALIKKKTRHGVVLRNAFLFGKTARARLLFHVFDDGVYQRRESVETSDSVTGRVFGVSTRTVCCRRAERGGPWDPPRNVNAGLFPGEALLI